MSIDTVRTIALGTVALGQTLFVVLYFTFPWYKTFLGRALFAKAMALMVILDLFMVNRVFEIPYQQAVFIGLYFGLAVGVWFQFFAFLHVRRQGRQNDSNVSGNGERR